MRRIFHNYNKWECYKNGMWNKYNESLLEKTIEFTSNHVEYGKAMVEVSNKWHYSCEHFLSNKSINRLAYIGHAATCFKIGASESTTRKAWGFLTIKQMDSANLEALKAIKEWEQKKKLELTLKSGKVKDTEMEYQMKLQLN